MGKASVQVRSMRPSDLVEVARVTDAAFGDIIGKLTGREVAPPVMPPLLFPTRLATDREGCFVATGAADELVGAVFSVARGTLGWFGPLAVSPDAQRRGVGRALIAACLDGLRDRGVRLVGLETFAESPFHVDVYSKFGFRPAWTGIGFRRGIDKTAVPADVATGAAPPNLDFVYEDLDLTAEATVAATRAVGATFTTADGFAIVHVEPTFRSEGTGFVPFVAAATRPSFDRLIDAVEHACGEQGLGTIEVRVPGSAWPTIDRLVARGYRPGRVEVRMKRGERPDYDRGDFFYADNWL